MDIAQRSLTSQGLISLPLDTHIEIFTNLNPLDVLSLRKTCKALADVTKHRALCVTLLLQMCRRDGVYSSTYNVEAMSLKELEYAVSGPIRCIRKPYDHLSPRRSRTLGLGSYDSPCPQSLSPETSDMFYLIPGGRFFVMLQTDDGVLSVWDFGTPWSPDPAPLPEAPIARAHTKGDQLRVHASPDGRALRITTLLPTPAESKESQSLEYKIEIFEIDPLAVDVKLSQIATTSFTGRKQEIYRYAVVGDRLVVVVGGDIKVWDFVQDSWASWNTNASNAELILTTASIILVGVGGIQIWEMPSIMNKSVTKALSEPLVPRLQVPYPDDYRVPDHAIINVKCDWYTNFEPLLLYFDIINPDTYNGFIDRFSIDISGSQAFLTKSQSSIPLPKLMTETCDWSSYRVAGNVISSLAFNGHSVYLYTGTAKPIGKLHCVDVNPGVFGLEPYARKRQISFCPVSGRLCAFQVTDEELHEDVYGIEVNDYISHL